VNRVVLIVTFGALVLAGASGFLASTALSRSAPATRTVTIDVGRGATGPAGPAGPRGPAGAKGERGERGATGPSGATSCPSGFELGELVINHPHGQVRLFGCLETP
jgi:hypothetical protein